MRMQPTEYKEFEDSPWLAWQEGTVELDSLNISSVKNGRITVEGVKLYALAFGRHIWNAKLGWLDRGKPIPFAPKSIMR